MGQIILSNCRVWGGGYNLSGDLNAIALNDTPDILNDTHFGHTAKSRKQGLEMITADLEGFFNAEGSDRYFSTLGTVNIPMTITVDPTIGGMDYPAYSFKSQNVEYNWGGSVGEMGRFSVKSESVGEKMIRGWLLENGATERIITGTGTAFEFGAVGAAQYLYGVLHVTAAATVAGDKLDVVIESDSVATFDVTPENQIAFTQVAGDGGVTYQWATPVAGAIADTFWRAKWTVTNVGDPIFNFVVFMGIA